MNKFLSLASKAFHSLCELIMALSVALAIFIFVIMGLIEALDFYCYVIGSSEGLCLTF
mgnify:CR=1 FL=1